MSTKPIIKLRRPDSAPAPAVAGAPPAPPAETGRKRLTAVPVLEEDEFVDDEQTIKIRAKVHELLIQDLDVPSVGAEHVIDERVVRAKSEDVTRGVLQESGVVLPKRKQELLVQGVVDEVLGFGPMQVLLDDKVISEVMVNGARDIFVERKGKIHRARKCFIDDDHVRRIIDRILAPLGRRVNERTPLADGRLPDGSRVNVIIPPLALNGPTITIRKFPAKRLNDEDLIGFGALTPPMRDFLQACVEARLNIIISGGTGSGKTTLLNVMSSFIPKDERIVTAEDAHELQLAHENLVTLESRPPNIEGQGEVSIRELVRNSLRMRPDRIVIGEVRGGECLDMLQAMNTGHDGSLSTVHSNGPRDTISRMQTMALMAGLDLPAHVINKQIASAVHMIVHQARLSDGSRRVTHITEVQGMEGETVLLQDIFIYDQKGVDSDGKVLGEHKPTGFRPKCYQQLVTHGAELPPGLFQ